MDTPLTTPLSLWGIISVLAGVIIFLYRKLQFLQDRYNANQELRITEAKEARDKITEPLEKQALMSEKIYDLLLNFTSRGQ